MVRMREMKESHKIVAQALARLKPGPVKADAPKVVLPDREAMKTHMDALIHHFLIVAEGFDVPAGEVYHARLKRRRVNWAFTSNPTVGQSRRACISADRVL